MSVKVGEQRSVQLPPQTTILDVFDNPTISGKFLILGKPGGGKTTTLLELAEALIERAEGNSDAPIPVILELSSWQEVTKRKFLPFGEREKYDPSIKEWVLSQLMSKGVSQEMGEQWLREKELVLLLDGLDELRSERQAKCVQAISQFLSSEFSPLHLVVCSRKEEYEDYEEMLHLNGAICLEDLTNEQIRHYFASVNLGEFWESIKGSEKIVDFIRQPLFLAVTSLAYQQIDVEEWRNCNTEERAIDYLLGVFCVDRLTRKAFKKENFEGKDFDPILLERRLIWLAKYCTKFESGRNWVELDKFDPKILFNKKQDFYKIINPARYIILILSNCIPLFYFGYVYFSKISDFSIQVEWSYNTVGAIFMLFLIGSILAIPFTIISNVLFGLVMQDNIRILQATKITTTLGILCISLVSAILISSVYVLAFWLIIAYFLLLPEGASFLDVFAWIWYTWLPLTFGISPMVAMHLLWNEDNIEVQSNSSKKTGKAFTQPFTSIAGILSANIFSVFFWLAYYTLFTHFLFSYFLNTAPEPWLVFAVIISICMFGCGGYDIIKLCILIFLLYRNKYIPLNFQESLNCYTKIMILQRVGNRYRFIHRLVQEHFAKLEIEKE
ncbi:NACHT domain-containing protein [Limnospira platensis]|uniref:NACHT domain-containing protein n=1 Tax=Limnospira platensis TaxID=118562 RepID=UPI003D6FAC20